MVAAKDSQSIAHAARQRDHWPVAATIPANQLAILTGRTAGRDTVDIHRELGLPDTDCSDA